MREIEIPEIIGHLMGKPAITDLIDKIYWGLPRTENKTKPYVIIDIVSSKTAFKSKRMIVLERFPATAKIFDASLKSATRILSGLSLT